MDEEEDTETWEDDVEDLLRDAADAAGVGGLEW